MRWHKHAIVLAAVVGLVCLVQVGWIHAKAGLAQLLIARAWERAQDAGADARPWPWADTQPVARLQLPGDVPALFVLEGSSGRNLAFGPTLDPASVRPGEPGNSVIAGHRDTHFAALEILRVGDRLQVELPGDRKEWFVVDDLQVVDSRRWRIGLGGSAPRLTLVTCYPFDAVNPSGPLRYVVTAAGTHSATRPVPPRSARQAAGRLLSLM
jgi:sortase A